MFHILVIFLGRVVVNRRSGKHTTKWLGLVYSFSVDAGLDIVLGVDDDGVVSSPVNVFCTAS